MNTAPMRRVAAWLGQRISRYLSASVHVHGTALPTPPARLAACLRPGDVLLVEGQTRVSVAIKYLTQSTWSHAALYVGEALGGHDARGLPLTFKLFGYAYRELACGEKLAVHGAYELESLGELLAEWQTDLVWLPAQWPETYSYTLSHCYSLGLPVLVSNLGAPADRAVDRPYSWIFDWQASPADWNDQLLQIASSTPPAPATWTPAASSSRFYRTNYLCETTNPLPEAPLPTRDFLARTRWQPFSQGQKMRLRVLGTLLGLRSHPALAWLARRIPMSLQRRIKNRLLGQAPE